MKLIKGIKKLANTIIDKYKFNFFYKTFNLKFLFENF